MFDASKAFARRARRRRHRNDDPALSGSRARAGYSKRRLSHPLAGETSGSEESVVSPSRRGSTIRLVTIVCWQSTGTWAMRRRIANTKFGSALEPDLQRYQRAVRKLRSNSDFALSELRELANQGSKMGLLKLGQVYSRGEL